MSTRVTSKGQVTIPKAVRDRLRIKPGTAVDFELAADGRVFIVKTGRKPFARGSVFARLRGSAGPGMTTDEIMALTRGE
jgi:AbrB family looped-hinge helix DNA binding protein